MLSKPFPASGYDAPLPPPQDEQTVMKVRDGPVPRSGLADQILALLHCRRRLMFLDIARRFSDCTWQMLFDALMRLRKQQRIELVAHQWDYEVLLLSGVPADPNHSGSPEIGERCEREQRMPV
jgi:hypothetical protein